MDIYIIEILYRNTLYRKMTDKRPSQKLALSKGESRGNIETSLQVRFELYHLNHLLMT